MTLTAVQKSKALDLLDHSDLLEEKAKTLIQTVLETEGELDETTLKALSTWIDSENRYLEAKTKELETQIDDEEKKAQEADEKVYADSERIEADLKRMFQEEVDKAVHQMNEVDKKAEQAQEKLIHEEVEESEIDALHDMLKNNPKKSEGA